MQIVNTQGNLGQYKSKDTNALSHVITLLSDDHITVMHAEWTKITITQQPGLMHLWSLLCELN